ncbi:MAG: DNA replication/repair protein RecF [Actinomycetota bacterium]|nr:DNA replication/repair protein RecF [Actinomycetota bacterium]
MFIKSINLRNFRNYSDFSVDIDKGLNFLIGRNAVGKTNLLEAIYFLENGRSHRTNLCQDLIKWNEEYLSVRATVVRKNRELSIESILSKASGKTFKVNGVEKSKIRGLEKPIITIIFTPDHLKIVKETPEHRRAYLDEVLSKIKPDYNYWRLQYLRILKQRNALLKKVFTGRMKQDLISHWDKQLIFSGIKLINARKEVIKRIEGYASDAYRKMSGGNETLKLQYENQVLKIEAANGLEDKFNEELKRRRKDEIERGQTLVGPHRDDVCIFINGIDTRTFGSQGEQRSVALALKMSELKIIEDMINESPILLLDDVMSELDDDRRRAFIEQINKNTQIIITSTKSITISDDIDKRANTIRIS